VPDIVPRRRVLLASAAALPMLLATAGCRSQDVFAGPDPLAGRPPLGRDVLTLQAVIAAEEQLVGLYRAAVAVDPQPTVRARMLGSLLTQHEQHLAQLRARLIEPAGQASSSPAARPSATTAGPPSGPKAAAVSIPRLRAAERASAARLVGQLATVPPALAQLFASIAASDAAHVTALGG
jgi:hypothetical protein